MNTKNKIMRLSELGYSKEQAEALAGISSKSASGTIISGFITSVKSPLQARIMRTFRSEEKFREKRRRREIKHQK